MKHYILIICGILSSIIGYTQEIQIKTIDKNSNAPISFVKVSSGDNCIGFTNENGVLIINISNIINNKILLTKSIYQSKEVSIEKSKENMSFDLAKFQESELPNYSTEKTYALLEQVLDNSQKSSPQKQFTGFVNYSFSSSLSTNQAVKNDIKTPFFVTSTKIKTLKKIDKTIKVWLKSTLKSEPIRYRTYKSLYKKSAYTYSVESSYLNELGETILIINIKDNDFHHTQVIVNDSKKIILEFHNYWNADNDNGISEPDYHAIYSLNKDTLNPEYLVAKYCYKKNKETDIRKIKVIFK